MTRKDFSYHSWPRHISTQQVSFTPTKQNQSKLKQKRSILQLLHLKHENLICNKSHLQNLTLKRIVVPTIGLSVQCVQSACNERSFHLTNKNVLTKHLYTATVTSQQSQCYYRAHVSILQSQVNVSEHISSDRINAV